MEESDRSIGNIKTKGGPRPQANMFLPVDASENALLASVFTVEELIARLGLARGEVGDEGSHISLLLSFLGLARFGNFVRGNASAKLSAAYIVVNHHKISYLCLYCIQAH
jgi:hypothetical protein